MVTNENQRSDQSLPNLIIEHRTKIGLTANIAAISNDSKPLTTSVVRRKYFNV